MASHATCSTHPLPDSRNRFEFLILIGMLLVGIGTTLFCSTVVTRIFFDWVVARKKGTHQTISI